MKKIITTLSIGIISISLFFNACKSEDNPIAFSAIGTIESQNAIYIDQDTITIYTHENIPDEYEVGDRVIAYFEKFESSSEGNIQVRITNLIKIPIQGIIPVIDDENDTLFNNSIVSIHRMWLSKDFITVDFNYHALDPELHKFQLAKKNTETNVDTIRFDFRHNAGGEEGGSQIRNMLSFNIDTLKPLAKDSVVVAIRTRILQQRTSTNQVDTFSINTRYFYYK